MRQRVVSVTVDRMVIFWANQNPWYLIQDCNGDSRWRGECICASRLNDEANSLPEGRLSTEPIRKQTGQVNANHTAQMSCNILLWLGYWAIKWKTKFCLNHGTDHGIKGQFACREKCSVAQRCLILHTSRPSPEIHLGFSDLEKVLARCNQNLCAHAESAYSLAKLHGPLGQDALPHDWPFFPHHSCKIQDKYYQCLWDVL